ncbi:hypothetical protein D3C86_1504020 [compost metagenome]
MDREVRMPLHECLQMRRDMHAPEGGGCGNLQCAVDGVGAAGDEILRFLQPFQDGQHSLVKALSRFGQRNLPRGALEKSCAELFFQPLDALGNHGGRIAKLLGGERHAAGGGNACEDFQIAQICHSCP